MTKVSRKPLPKEDWEEFYDQICKAMTMLETKGEIKVFLNDLLTYTEKKMFSKRLQIARNLRRGMTYDLIGLRLNVTDNTIASVNEVLNTTGHGYAKVDGILSELEKEKLEKIKEAVNRAENPIRTRQTGIKEVFDSGLSAIERKVRRRHRLKSVR